MKSSLSAPTLAALEFAKRGIPVHPLHANTKRPILLGWNYKASTKSEEILSWATKYPGCNFGAMTGNGLVVLDIDVKGGKDGMSSLAQIAGDSAAPTLTVRTPSGGIQPINSAL